MAKLQTTIDNVLYDARDNKFGRIVFEMNSKREGDFYTIEVTDYAENTVTTTIEVEVGGETQQEERESVVSNMIRQKSFTKPAAEIDGLYAMVSRLVPKTLPYSEQQKKVEQLAFLAYMRNDFIKDQNQNPIEGVLIYKLLPDQIVVRE